MSVYVVRAFICLRAALAANRELASRIEELEKHLEIPSGMENPDPLRIYLPSLARKTVTLPLRFQLQEPMSSPFRLALPIAQKLSFLSLRKCWKCSLIGIILAIGWRSPFQERL